MANLKPEEKELLAVIRYYNEQRKKKNVDRLIGKFFSRPYGGLEIPEIAALTGFSEDEVTEMVNWSLAPKRKKKADVVAEPEPTRNSERLAIHLNAESDAVQRIAYDVAKAIERELEPGDMLWGSKELNQNFGATSGNVAEVRRILVSHNWIQPVDESNKRKGYVVK
jgi:phosphoribosyl-AMP cyclohydrolase